MRIHFHFQPSPKRKHGFALIITLTLMMLLVVIAVGLLTLSGISLRSGSRGEAMAVAQSNARLALMLAIGEIQKDLGPDQKISAVSEILNSGGTSATPLQHPYLTGVWNSRQEVLDDRRLPDYDEKKAFRKWLVSSSEPDALLNSEFAKNGSFPNPVRMVCEPTSDGMATYAGKIEVSASNPANKSGIAWWVGDENCKGFTNPVDSHATADTAPTVPDLLAASGTAGANGMKALIPDYPVNTPEAAKVLTLGQMELAAPGSGRPQKWFHDLSPHASGLLTNVSKGGLRQDLNLYLEQPRAAEPWPGTPAPGPNSKYALSEVNDYDVLAWKYLYHFYHLKERIAMSGGRPYLRSWNGATGAKPDDWTNPRWNAGVIRPGPVLIRAVIFISFGSIPAPNDPSKLVLRFYAQPVLTLWNPYNVDLKLEANQPNYLFTSLPMGQKIFVNGQLKETFTWRGNARPRGDGANDYTGAGLQPLIKGSVTLLPGEAKMFCPTSYAKAPIGIHQHHYMEAVPFRYSQTYPGGLWGGGSAGGTVDDQQIVQSVGMATDRVQIETYVNRWDLDGGAFHRAYPSTFDIRSEHADGTDGAYTTFEWGQKVDWQHQSGTPAIASPDRLTKTNKPSATFGEIRNAPRPFMVVDVQLKALDEMDLPNKTWRDCIPSHPFMGVTQASSRDVTPYLAGAYKLRFETINSYQEASSYLQIAPDNPVHTYFGGSHFPGDGQSWITDREIPLAPFTSLSQLQHLPQHSVDNLYSSGYFFQNRAIGNSFASPGVPSNKIKSDGWPFNVDVYMNSSGGTIFGNKFPGDEFHRRPNIDRSYAANLLLWDDYFFSSMAAQNDVLRSASARKGLDRVVREFFESGQAIPNPRYRAYLGEKNAAAVTKALLRGDAPTTNAFRDVAAYLTVDGSFNINSVSVPAWKTMLAAAHERNMVVMNGAGGAPKSVGQRKFVVSRFAMPNLDSSGPGSSADDSKWQGYHELTETQLNELAEAIVRQVKQRGPFRSLAEFINRRLGAESDERTRDGALQGALEDQAVSINQDYRTPEITTANLSGATYQNKTAALGSCYQGSPACVTQADLLNAIGPVISARSDTFTVRAYGEARDASGKVIATAWCEGVVRRVPSFIDPADAATTALTALRAKANKNFGRRFNLVAFRWLSANEI